MNAQRVPARLQFYVQFSIGKPKEKTNGLKRHQQQPMERGRKKSRLHNALLKLTFNLIDYYGCAHSSDSINWLLQNTG